MKYFNLHLEKPDPHKLIYWHGPNGKDILGRYRGKMKYEEVERKYPGFVPKWWYYAEEILNETIDDPMFPKADPRIAERLAKKEERERKKLEALEKVPGKRGPKPKVKETQQPETKIETKLETPVSTKIKVRKPGEKPIIGDDFLDFF